jgi:rhomboid protease GluP
LHADFMHIFFNAYALYIIGFTVERYFGTARFALIYFLGGLGASIASLALTPAPAVGASGAIFAIFGAEGVFFYQHRKLFGEAGRRHLNNLIFVAALNLVLGFASSASSGGARIDNWAHVGGLVGGVLLTWFIGPRIQAQFIGSVTEPAVVNQVNIVDTNPLKRSWPAALAFAILLAVALGAVGIAN